MTMQTCYCGLTTQVKATNSNCVGDRWQVQMCQLALAPLHSPPSLSELWQQSSIMYLSFQSLFTSTDPFQRYYAQVATYLQLFQICKLPHPHYVLLQLQNVSSYMLTLCAIWFVRQNHLGRVHRALEKGAGTVKKYLACDWMNHLSIMRAAWAEIWTQQQAAVTS